MSVGKEMLMVKHLWGVSPISPSPLWALGPSLALGQFQGAQRGLSVCLSILGEDRLSRVRMPCSSIWRVLTARVFSAVGKKGCKM